MASNENPKTVLLSGDPVQYEDVLSGEASVRPGTFVEYSAEGVEAGAAKTPRMVRERDSIGAGIDEEIEPEDQVVFYVHRRGDHVYALCTGDISRGDKLEANADGKLVPQDAGVAIATALESVDTNSDVARIRAEIV